MFCDPARVASSATFYFLLNPPGFRLAFFPPVSASPKGDSVGSRRGGSVLTSRVRGGKAAQALRGWRERVVGRCGSAGALQPISATTKDGFCRYRLISCIIAGLFCFLFLAATRQDVIKPPRSRFGLRVLSPLRHRERGDEPSPGLAAFPGRPHS